MMTTEPIRHDASRGPGTNLPDAHPYATLRSGLRNSAGRFLRNRSGRVAYLGGSITAMGGWRDLVGQDLQRRFPGTRFDFVSAGIPSLGSTPHAFRLQRDVLSRGRVDLLFVEAAVNDSTNGFSDTAQVRAMEGIVRHARAANPFMDILFMHFVDPEKIALIRQGITPPVIVNHEKVAGHYGLPSLDLALEVTRRMDAGEFTWAQFRDLHPSPFGHEIYARSIRRVLDLALVSAPRARRHTLPPRPLDTHNYEHGQLVAITEARPGPGWAVVPDWTPTRGDTRPGFVHIPMLTAETPGATCTFPFIGTAVGIFVAAGYDAGMLDFSVDGAPFRRQDLFTAWSAGLHLPWTYMLEDELAPGPHELTLRVAEPRHAASQGHAARIAHFLVNGT